MTKRIAVLGMLFVLYGGICDDTIPTPWQELKELYQEKIERTMEDRLKGDPTRISIQETSCILNLTEKSATGSLLVSGQLISGKPELIRLRLDNLIPTGHIKVDGGNLTTEGGDGVFLLPDGKESFQVACSFSVPLGEDKHSSFVRFTLPHALKNSLKLNMSPSLHILEHPGVETEEGVFHFSNTKQVLIRFKPAAVVPPETKTEIDAVHLLSFQGSRSTLETAFLPRHTPAGGFIIKSPQGGRFVSTTLRTSHFKPLENGNFQVTVPAGEDQLFSVQFSIPRPDDGELLEFTLPRIIDNTGNSDNLVFLQPEDGRAAITAKGSTAGISAKYLPTLLRAAVNEPDSFIRIPHNEIIRLAFHRYHSVEMPQVIFDEMHIFTAFDENGATLTTLRMEIPGHSGPQLRIRSIPDAKVWELTVNGKKQNIYSGEDSHWIVPLVPSEHSLVELTFLRQAKKLGLHGRVEAIIPATDIPVHHLQVNIALPHRVLVTSFEGPVTPTSEGSENPPKSFVGVPHHYNRSFYKGEGAKIALFYEEPKREERNRMDSE